MALLWPQAHRHVCRTESVRPPRWNAGNRTTLAVPARGWDQTTVSVWRSSEVPYQPPIPLKEALQRRFPLMPHGHVFWHSLATTLHGVALVPRVDSSNSRAHGPCGLSDRSYSERPPCRQPGCFTAGLWVPGLPWKRQCGKAALPVFSTTDDFRQWLSGTATLHHLPESTGKVRRLAYGNTWASLSPEYGLPRGWRARWNISGKPHH